MCSEAQVTDEAMAGRYLADARFRVYLDYARERVPDADASRLTELAVRLYRWNVKASAVAIGYISFIEVFVRNAIDLQLREWISGQEITGLSDWLETGKSDPVGRIRSLINSADRDYLTDARNTALRKQKQWRRDQRHPRHGDGVTRDDVFSQLTFGTWDGMLSRSSRDAELAHVLMGAFPNIESAWQSEIRRMPKVVLPGNDGDSLEDRLRMELVVRLKSIRTIRNRISHDENLLRVEFPKLRHDMFFILNALGSECPNWAFPDKGEPLKTLSPDRCVTDWLGDTEKTK
ncbi:hypothetical protein [Bifidobacterium platyrrhinorum]|uniref:Abi-like protein n=1 Tax=Bifidobacterium platyrrhinorum TaxID=2661628 RepID=A0A6L9SRH3_9BIFI|nr:hypothetical protein [Bifidobacterium platyrrhinorum]NEG55147.1 hypothetical protein [Bifidobacterium platyrrhinorum]